MTLNQFYRKYNSDIENAVRMALQEDMVYNDITTNAVIPGKYTGKKISAELICKQDCIAAGLKIFRKVYSIINPGTKFVSYYKDGDFIGNNNIVLKVKSSLKDLLIGERTALNFLQKMSGIATLTRNFVKMLKFNNAKVLHTRKTTPGFRLFEVAAVKTGGGDFHRFNLNSSVMIKDNHIIAAGSVKNALSLFRRNKDLKGKIEIEVKSLSEVQEVVEHGAGLVSTVMLDNFKRNEIDFAVKSLKSSGYKIELSGGINLSNFKKIQRNGIDYYSIGALTHSFNSVDFSLEF